MDENMSEKKLYWGKEFQLFNQTDLFTNELESFYNNFSDSKKLTQLSVPNREMINDWETKYQRDIPTTSKETADFCSLTSVSTEEATFLDDFMAFGSSPEYDNIDKECNTGSRLADLEVMRPNPYPLLRETNINPSTTCHPLPNSFSSKYYAFPCYTLEDEQENRQPRKRKLQSTFASNISHGNPNKPLKVMKSNPVGTATVVTDGGGSYSGEQGVRWGLTDMNYKGVLNHQDVKVNKKNDHMSEVLGGNNNSGGLVDGRGESSILRQQLQGGPKISKPTKTQETFCKDCNKIITAKCLLKVCKKSSEVNCSRCGQELTAKCLLQVCPDNNT